MDRITAGHVKTLVASILRMMKEIKVSGEIGEDSVPTPAVREGGKVGYAKYRLDEVSLEFHHKQKEATETPEDSTEKILVKVQASR